MFHTSKINKNLKYAYMCLINKCGSKKQEKYYCSYQVLVITKKYTSNYICIIYASYNESATAILETYSLDG